jgi:hypothetical protein
LEGGVFGLVFAQAPTADGTLRFDVFVKDVGNVTPQSKVLKADDNLSGLDALCETGEAAG